MTLIQKGGRRCDASCHEAIGRECRCVCHGQNHGRDLGEYRSNPIEIIVKPRKIPKHERQQLKLFELPED
jgi:hypothetical protein